jgi:hypothetical protein
VRWCRLSQGEAQGEAHPQPPLPHASGDENMGSAELARRLQSESSLVRVLEEQLLARDAEISELQCRLEGLPSPTDDSDSASTGAAADAAEQNGCIPTPPGTPPPAPPTSEELGGAELGERAGVESDLGKGEETSFQLEVEDASDSEEPDSDGNSPGEGDEPEHAGE